jgi:hypothetical protein
MRHALPERVCVRGCRLSLSFFSFFFFFLWGLSLCSVSHVLLRFGFVIKEKVVGVKEYEEINGYGPSN